MFEELGIISYFIKTIKEVIYSITFDDSWL